MRRMTFFRLTVYSDTTIIGSVAISTREILGIPKKGEDTIFLDFDAKSFRDMINYLRSGTISVDQRE